MSEDGKKVYFNTPENVEALQFWLDLQNKYKSMASGIVQWTDLPTQFLAGEVAMIYHTTGNFANIRDNAKFNYGVAFLPGNKRVAAPTGGGNFYITPNLSPEKEAAAWKRYALNEGHVYSDVDEVMLAYQTGQVHLHSRIALPVKGMNKTSFNPVYEMIT